LLGLLSPSTGDVFVDDVPLRDIDRAAWLSRVSLAGQDADLLEGTLEENIKMGHPGGGEHDVQWALSVTGASEFVATLPEGLHTRVGDRGMRFSGGQRQRLTLARAIVGRPAVLVLDEATNAIQADSEAIVLDRLRAALPDATILVIAHRSEAVGIADTILRVANGRVIEAREATASERSISPPALHAVVRE
jgi:ABC-type multidrug transport system fused ATPase/permease subunit